MQCPSCHNEVSPQSSFCGFCGATLQAAPAGGGAGFTPVASAAGPGSPQVTGAVSGAGGLSENAAAAIAYITIIPAIIFLVIEPYNKMRLVRFHSVQSIALNVVAIILQIGLAILQVALHFIPGIWMIFPLLHLCLGLALFIGWLLAIFKASKGEFYKLPLIGDFAAKQAGV
jgi:uncharacterized membrane protein